MLEIKNLQASVNNKQILKGLNLTIKTGELHAIMGPNGSGKSTLANVLSGKDGYEISGELNFNGQNLKKIPVEDDDEPSPEEEFGGGLELGGKSEIRLRKISLFVKKRIRKISKFKY